MIFLQFSFALDTANLLSSSSLALGQSTCLSIVSFNLSINFIYGSSVLWRMSAKLNCGVVPSGVRNKAFRAAFLMSSKTALDKFRVCAYACHSSALL